MTTVSPTTSHMSPQGTPRHGSPQPAGMQQQPTMRPPDHQMRMRFVRPTGPPGAGKEMRPRIVPPGPMQPGQRFGQMPQQTGGPRPGLIRQQSHPGSSPQYPSAGSSPNHAMSPQPGMIQGQRRPPSASGSIPSPAADRPVTPQTPRTPGGPPTPGQVPSQPSPMGDGGDHHPAPPQQQQQQYQQPPMMAPQQQQFHPPPHSQHQIIPHPQQQQPGQQQVMMPQQPPQQQQHPQQMQHGGGGNPNIAPVDDEAIRGGWKKSIGLKGGKAIRGGWGAFIGLKGGSPPIITQSSGTPAASSSVGTVVNAPTVVAVTPGGTTAVQTSSGINPATTIYSNLPRGTTVLTVVGTTNPGNPAASGSQTVPKQILVTNMGAGPTVIPVVQAAVTSVVSQQGKSDGILVATAPTGATAIVQQPDVNQMPPSSAHQANIGIPGGFNPRENIALPKMLGAANANPLAVPGSARYPTPATTQNLPVAVKSAPPPPNQTPTTSAPPAVVSVANVPPMPPATKTLKLSGPVNVKTAVSDSVATVGISSAVETTPSVLAMPLTTVPAAATSLTVTSSSGSAASAPSLSAATTTLAEVQNAISINTSQAVMPTSVHTGNPPKVSLPTAPVAKTIIKVTTATTAQTTTPASSAPSTTPSTGTETTGNKSEETTEHQNALLKQLLSSKSTSSTSDSVTTTSTVTSSSTAASSTPTTTSSNSATPSNISLEAQLDRPPAASEAKFKQFQQQKEASLSSLASKIPQPLASAAPSTTPAATTAPATTTPATTTQQQNRPATVVVTQQQQPSQQQQQPGQPMTPSTPTTPMPPKPIVAQTGPQQQQQQAPSKPPQSVLNLPTEPVPQASLASQNTNQNTTTIAPEKSTPAPIQQVMMPTTPAALPTRPTQIQPGQQGGPRPGMQQMRPIMSANVNQMPQRPMIVRNQVPQQVTAPGVVVRAALPQTPVQTVRPPIQQNQGEKQQTGQPTQGSQLQGLLQKQTLVPQEQLQQQQPQQQQVQQANVTATSNVSQQQPQPPTQQQQVQQGQQQPQPTPPQTPTTAAPQPPVSFPQQQQVRPQGPSQAQMMQQQQQQQHPQPQQQPQTPQHQMQQQPNFQQPQEMQGGMMRPQGMMPVATTGVQMNAQRPPMHPVSEAMEQQQQQQQQQFPPGAQQHPGMRPHVPISSQHQQQQPPYSQAHHMAQGPGQPHMMMSMHPQQHMRPHPQHMQHIQQFRMNRPAMIQHPEQQQIRPQYPNGPPGRMSMRLPVSQHMPGGPSMPMQQRMGPPPGALRLAIPPPGAQQHPGMMGPGPPGTPNSQQPSPALTPRSDGGDDYGMDSGSSRGHTPAPDFDGASPDGSGAFFPNGEPPQKMIKGRRPSAAQQQKRRLSQQTGADMGAAAKKRARKGSKVDENDYDSCVDNIVHKLKNQFPPVQTMEPKLGHYLNACPIFGSGDVPKFGPESDLKLGELREADQGSMCLPEEGDYYNMLPLGEEPPVPFFEPVNLSTRGFYKQEFEANNRFDRQNMPGNGGAESPDVYCSSSPEPEPCVREKPFEIWNDLEPDDSEDENVEEKKPQKFIERPRSPTSDLWKPIPVSTKPKQLISMSDINKEVKFEDEIARAKAKSFLPPKSNGSTTSVTMTLGGNGTTKSVLKVLNGLAKLLKIDPPKQWIMEDRNGIHKDVFRAKDRDPVDMLAVLIHDRRLCRHCEVVLTGSMVKRKSAELPFMTKQEKEDCGEVYFCDANCYFQFSIGRTNGANSKLPSGVSNLEQLMELQDKYNPTPKTKKEKRGDDSRSNDNGPSSANDDRSSTSPKHKGRTYKQWSSSTPSVMKKHKRLNENELTQMMFQMGTTMMPPRETEDMRECLFCHMRGDAAADGPARLLNYDVNKWVHLNCALWSEEVYETVSGALVNVETALKNGQNAICKICEKNGATVKCWKVRCTNHYHVGCATKDKAMFYKKQIRLLQSAHSQRRKRSGIDHVVRLQTRLHRERRKSTSG